MCAVRWRKLSTPRAITIHFHRGPLSGRLDGASAAAFGTGLFEYRNLFWSETALVGLGLDRASLPEITSAPYSGLANAYAGRCPLLAGISYPIVGPHLEIFRKGIFSHTCLVAMFLNCHIWNL